MAKWQVKNWTDKVTTDLRNKQNQIRTPHKVFINWNTVSTCNCMEGLILLKADSLMLINAPSLACIFIYWTAATLCFQLVHLSVNASVLLDVACCQIVCIFAGLSEIGGVRSNAGSEQGYIVGPVAHGMAAQHCKNRHACQPHRGRPG